MLPDSVDEKVYNMDTSLKGIVGPSKADISNLTNRQLLEHWPRMDV
jgi:hypothetical protein